MRTIPVNTARAYEILVGGGLLAQAGGLCRQVNRGSRALIVTDSHVGPLYAVALQSTLEAAGYATGTFVFAAGEQSKRLDTVFRIYARLAEDGFTRSDLIVALGGGVTGDMAGFAAATWLRGIDFVQIPTSLLALVDSSVGGKTGVDVPAGKNLVGAFWQPVRVIADPGLLETLPPAFFTDGMAEVIKAACIRDAALFAALEEGGPLEGGRLEDVIVRCIEIKRDVVERDEQEAGERKLLNFGHTWGHALEKYYQYHALTHGCAVAVGMAAVTAAGERRGLTAPGTAARVRRTLQRWGLPAGDPAPWRDVLPGAMNDKKRDGAQLDLVLLREIGNGVIHRLPAAQLGDFLFGE